jgi:hypothetical protein
VLPREVRLTDISDGGARLYIEAAVPDHFTLLLGSQLEHARECRVAWRLGNELGVEFTDSKAGGFAKRVAV